MNKQRFQFGQVVVVDGDQIGCILKTWVSSKNLYTYDVYVRSYNAVVERPEEEIVHYIYNKELLEEEVESY